QRALVPSAKVAQAAALACVGGVEARNNVLTGLTSADDDDVQVAQVYLRHRPITTVEEVRLVTTGVAKMRVPAAQVRALDTLARQRLSDRESIDALAKLFPVAESVNVQRAIAGVIIRADYHALEKPEMARVLAESRLKSSGGDDIIDILIRRLRAP
ncbi:MAG: hypothetical protein ABI831_27455, partial [Betaproteobacteria bacterium]